MIANIPFNFFNQNTRKISTRIRRKTLFLDREVNKNALNRVENALSLLVASQLIQARTSDEQSKT